MHNEQINYHLAEQDLNKLQSDLHTFLTAVRTEYKVPGIGIALSINGQPIDAHVGEIAIGTATGLSASARFQIGCITKLLTCIQASCLIDERILDKEAPIGQYLEELRETDKGRNIAVWHLMSHTSGYQGLNIVEPSIGYFYTWSKFIEFLKHTPQLFVPGSVFSYEHSEHVLLGEIIRRLTKSSLYDLFKKRIVGPMGLAVGTLRGDGDWPGIAVADHSYNDVLGSYARLRGVAFAPFWTASLSDWTMTLTDLARLADALMGINFDAGKDAPSTSALEFVQRQVVKLPSMVGSSHSEQMPAAFGLGCAAYRGWLLGHNGSARGQTCGMRFDPRLRVSVAVGINAWQPQLRDRIISHIFSSLRGQPLPHAPPALSSFELGELTGRYVGLNGLLMTVSLAGRDLVCVITQGTQQLLSVVMTKNERGALIALSNPQHHSIGFFTNPNTGTPCAMINLLAMCKQ